MGAPISPCCNAPTTFYDGLLGYESWTCDHCGRDIADVRAEQAHTTDKPDERQAFAGREETTP